MDSLVFAAVLLAAAAHAGWNAAIKRGVDPLVTTVLIAVGAGVVALPMLAVVGLPASPSRPWAIASVIVHLAYFAGLMRLSAGDMSQVYPIARGSAPLLTALVSTAWLGERLGLLGWGGLLCLVAGVMMLSLRGGGDLARLDRRAVGFALFTALTVCAYSVVAGMGARFAGSANAYTAALFAGIGPVMVLYARRAAVARRAVARLAHRASRRRAAVRLYGVALGDDGAIAVVAAQARPAVLLGADRGRGLARCAAAPAAVLIVATW
jgi:drug/metabolite transporter (DMT)-like permease